MKIADAQSLEMVRIEIRNRKGDTEYRESVMAEFTPQELLTYFLKDYIKLLEYVKSSNYELNEIMSFLNREVELTSE